MKGKMKAAILYKALDMKIESVEIPQIGANEVLVRMKCIGICGSDIHYYLEGRIGSFIVEKPLILGHECAGEIAEIGSKVTRLKVGQRVAIEPGFVDGECEYCRGGRYNLCKEVRFYGTPPYHGTFAEYAAAPEQNVYPLPENVSVEEGAMIEPLAVGMMAAKRGEVTVHDSVAILGAGPIGQMSLQAAKAYGALKTYVTDIVDYRLDYARRFGATAAINSTREDAADRINRLTNDGGVDVVIEASGAVSAIQQAIEIAKPGARIVFVGYPTTDVPVSIAKILSKELDIRGVHRYANVFEAAIRCVASGKVDVEPYITHRFPFEEILEGFEANIKKIGNPMKVQIIM